MIKKYNQFVNDRINEDIENFEDDLDINQEEPELADNELEEEFGEEEEMEEEGGDVYNAKLQEVADKLGVEVSNGKVEYNGKKIIFPSETEMYHVSNKKFKTADEVVSFLEGESNRLVDEEADDEMDEDERFVMRESKSYKNTRKFNKK